MRKLRWIVVCQGLLISCLLLWPLSGWSQHDRGSLRLGGQFGFGSDIESFGLGVRLDYALTSKLLLAPEFMYYFGDDDFGIEVDWYDINVNANYLIEINNPNVVPYVLGGLNIARVAVRCDGILSSVCEDLNDVEPGINLGGGVDFLLAGSLALFGELRAVISGANQVVFATGIKLPLN